MDQSDKNEVLTDSGNKDKDPIVQYILVRTDLKWGIGATIAQACHACLASVANTISRQTTKDYLLDLENMHKVILKVDKVEDLIDAEKRLQEANIPHHLWIEKPENIATCLAVAPQPKTLVKTLFQHLKLLR